MLQLFIADPQEPEASSESPAALAVSRQIKAARNSSTAVISVPTTHEGFLPPLSHEVRLLPDIYQCQLYYNTKRK